MPIKHRHPTLNKHRFRQLCPLFFLSLKSSKQFPEAKTWNHPALTFLHFYLRSASGGSRQVNVHQARSILTVRFMKLRNFFSISVMMEKSPLGRCSRTQVTFICRRPRVAVSGGLESRGNPNVAATFSPGCLGRGSPAAEPCRKPRCCPPCVCRRAAALQCTHRDKSVVTSLILKQAVLVFWCYFLLYSLHSLFLWHRSSSQKWRFSLLLS